MRLRIRTRPDNLAFHQLRGQNLAIEDADTGEQLDGVMAVHFECLGRSHPVVVTLTLEGVHVDLNVPVADHEAAALRLLKK